VALANRNGRVDIGHKRSTEVECPPPPRVCIGIRPEGKWGGNVRSRFVRLFSMTLRSGESPFKDAKGFGDGLVRGEDALLSFGANGSSSMSSSAPFEVECEILSVTPRLLVRLPETANPVGWFRLTTVQSRVESAWFQLLNV